MKEQWQRLELRIDALNLRERAMAFVIAALILITLINALVLDPLLERQQQLAQQIRQQQQQIAAMQTEIQATVKGNSMDPDAANRLRLAGLHQQQAQLHDEMLTLQKGLVSPDKMTALLEDILKQNGKLRLVSLKKLPVVALDDRLQVAGAEKNGAVAATGTANLAGAASAASAANPSGTQQKNAVDALYRHSVEVVVEGSYLDIMHYLSQLEAMPWHLFWAKARLNVETYPKASLTLTLFTLSLDKTWLNI